MALGGAGSLYAPPSGQTRPPAERRWRGAVEVSPSARSQQAADFSVMLLTLALVAGLLNRLLDPPQTLAYIIWGSTQLVAVLIMMFLVTDDGRTREGPVVLRLHRLAVRLWWMANTGLFILMFTVVAAFWLRRWLPGHPQKDVVNSMDNSQWSINSSPLRTPLGPP